MAIRASRIAWVGMAVIAAGSLWFLWYNRQRPEPVDPNNAPWIGLPRSGMDATQWSVRQVINQSFIGGSRYQGDSMSLECGDKSQTPGAKNRYAALIGNGWHGPYWRITMDVHGELIDISVRDGLFPPPPPPMHGKESSLFSPTLTLQKTRADLVRVRELWNDSSLWHAPQKEEAFSCRDGDPVFLEACVDGHYAARWRNCDSPAGEATIKLWRAFNEALPPPPKPEWRDTSGNPVPDPSSH